MQVTKLIVLLCLFSGSAILTNAKAASMVLFETQNTPRNSFVASKISDIQAIIKNLEETEGLEITFFVKEK